MAAGVLAACASPRPAPAVSRAAAPAGHGVAWTLSPERIATSCQAEIQRARARIEAVVAGGGDAAAAPARLVAIETAVADMNDALVAQQLLGHLAEDEAVRAASGQCNEALGAFRVALAADPGVYALARAAEAGARAPVDARLARVYVEAGRRAGAGLDPATRGQVTRLFEELEALERAYMRAIGEDQTTIEISAEEAASLSAAFLGTLAPRPDGRPGHVVPVNFGTMERFLKSQRSGAARERFWHAFYNRGGRANVERLEQALALRHRIAGLLGFESWAAYQLDARMARTPARALALVEEVGARLLPRARAEIAELARLKAEDGDRTPFAAWDHAFYEERLEQRRFGVDTEQIRAYFPLDTFVPAVLELYGALLGVTFQPIASTRAWAPGVREYAILDTASARPLGWFFLDLEPRPGKGLHYSLSGARLGRALPDGSRRLPIAGIAGSGPAAEPGKPALLSHGDAIIFFHEFGHLMHATLSTAPYASLDGVHTPRDFVEAPSQMLENWMWEPSILKKVSRHVTTGAPLPDALIARMIARRHVADGAFWTRQAFFAIYDLTVHGSGPTVDTSTLWRDLTVARTALPPVPDTIPQAGFAGFMGGYDAGYYGYLWSKVFAQDMFTMFEQGGLENPAIGMRYRREILEPGGTAEPEALLVRFLGRPVRTEAFYRAIGLAP
jgi:thimet oligopeptidase